MVYSVKNICRLKVKVIKNKKERKRVIGCDDCTPLIPALGRQRQTDLCEFKDSLVYRVIPGQRYTENLSQKVKVKKIEVKIKPHKDGKYTENLDTVCYYALFELFEC